MTGDEKAPITTPHRTYAIRGRWYLGTTHRGHHFATDGDYTLWAVVYGPGSVAWDWPPPLKVQATARRLSRQGIWR